MLDMYYILLFYFLSLIYSFLGFSLIRGVFGKFPDKGYALGRIVSLLVISYFSWLLSNIARLPIVTSSVLAIIVSLAVFVFFKKRDGLLVEIENIKTTIILEEIVFIVAFACMLLFRGAVPQIKDIEKFMDFAILNGLYRGQQVPPTDVWFSGLSMNYYYFGHFCLALVNKITQIPAAISYNLNVAYIFAISAIASLSIIGAITRNRSFSVVGALFFVTAGNLDLMYKELFRNVTNYFYADARSLIPNTINEFPSYSFLISDLHAHILDIPFVLLFIAFLVLFVLDIEVLRNKYALVLSSLSLGALAVINSWDYLVYAPLLFLTLSLIAFRDNMENLATKIRNSIFIGCLICIVGLVLFLFYFLSFRPASSGVGFSSIPLPVLPIFLMFGFFFAGGAFFSVYLFLKKRLTELDIFVGLLFLYGMVLVILPNFVFLKDIYSRLNPAFFRANTVFKMWYQAWIIFSIATPYAFYQIYIFSRKRNNNRLLGVVLALGSFLGYWVLKYPVTSVRYIVGASYDYKGLDGSAYLDKELPGVRGVISWLNENVKGQPVVLEDFGKPYSLDSVISAYTGLPTPVGWTEHELGWRDNWPLIAGRMGDIERMYWGINLPEVTSLVKRYNIEYVVITDKERAKYGNTAGLSLRELTEPVMKSGTAELLKVKILAK